MVDFLARVAKRPAESVAAADPVEAARPPSAQNGPPRIEERGEAAFAAPGSGAAGEPIREPPHDPVAGDASPAALLAVRYLPARVAISRALRFHGWEAVEAVDLPEILVRLRRRHFQAIFIEPAEHPRSALIPALLGARTAGAQVVGVGLRQRRAGMESLRPLGEIPHLLYPFQEA